MKNFIKKHPALEDTCDTVLALLSGSFALLVVGIVWIKGLVDRKKSRKGRRMGDEDWCDSGQLTNR